jgi:hypothetical protein
MQAVHQAQAEAVVVGEVILETAIWPAAQAAVWAFTA